MDVALARAAQELRIVVHVPADTPGGEPIYLAGSLATVGGWKADGLKLARQDDGTYAASISADAGEKLEFKITRGTWETVEKAADGAEMGNRSVAINAETKSVEVTVARWAGGAGAARASSVVGTLKLHKIESAHLHGSRVIRVWLPPNYDRDKEARFAVLYMHDGQNCFDRGTSAYGNEWEIDETLTKLIGEKIVPPIIVVGIDNGLGK